MIYRKPYDLRKEAKDLGVPYRLVVDQRIQEILLEMEKWEDYMEEKTNHIPYSTYLGCLEEIIELKNSLRKKLLENKDRITDEMKEKAKNYPVDSLIDFQRGMALCFNHAEKTPSLHYNAASNTCHCFGGCNKTFDSIEILMVRDGFSFIDAVKELNRR